MKLLLCTSGTNRGRNYYVILKGRPVASTNLVITGVLAFIINICSVSVVYMPNKSSSSVQRNQDVTVCGATGSWKTYKTIQRQLVYLRTKLKPDKILDVVEDSFSLFYG